MEYQDQELTHEIIGAAIEVHRNLGPGLLESVYRSCMIMELKERGLCFQCEMVVPLKYKGQKLDAGFRVDFLVEDKVLIELKSVETILTVHESQLLSYLRMLNRQVGLLINFNVAILKNGINRCVLTPL